MYASELRELKTSPHHSEQGKESPPAIHFLFLYDIKFSIHQHLVQQIYSIAFLDPGPNLSIRRVGSHKTPREEENQHLSLTEICSFGPVPPLKDLKESFLPQINSLNPFNIIII
jgi:hypothetical protein